MVSDQKKKEVIEKQYQRGLSGEVSWLNEYIWLITSHDLVVFQPALCWIFDQTGTGEGSEGHKFVTGSPCEIEIISISHANFGRHYSIRNEHVLEVYFYIDKELVDFYCGQVHLYVCCAIKNNTHETWYCNSLLLLLFSFRWTCVFLFSEQVYFFAFLPFF